MIYQDRIKNWKVHPSQRGVFGFELYKQMAKNENIWLLCMDLGWGIFDNHFQDFPKRCKNTGASESASLDVAVGLALEGKIVFVYTITSFFMRAAETIGLYLHGEQIPVKLVGSGRDKDYEIDGPSHDCTIAQDYLRNTNVRELYPDTKEEIPLLVKQMVESKVPTFISLKR